jgi:glutamate-1-semialdehyde aminotransferase
MTAGLTAMEMFDKQAVAQLNELGDYARKRLNEVIQETGVPFIRSLYDNGILIVSTGTGFLSTPMGRDEIERLAEAVELSLRKAWDLAVTS